MHFEPHIVFFPPRQCASLLYGFDYGASLSSIFLDCHHERENADASGGCGTVDGVKLSIERTWDVILPAPCNWKPLRQISRGKRGQACCASKTT